MSTQDLPHYSPGKYAVRHIDNWDGQRDVCTSFAQLDAAGLWTYTECGRPLLVHEGDKVLHAWPLEVCKTPASEVVGVRREWLLEWAEELMHTAQEGGAMHQQIKGLLDIHPRKPKTS